VEKKRVALTMFGFITPAAEAAKKSLEALGYEVVAFHANGTGGTAMEELAEEGWFDGILDLATHELADDLKQGYCKGMGSSRLEPKGIPRLVVPGGLDCAVLEFTRESIPPEYRDRKIFFYDFRSAIRLDLEETRFLARQLAAKMNRAPDQVKMLVPSGGWSEADRAKGPLYDPPASGEFMLEVRRAMHPDIEIRVADVHINDPAFAECARRISEKVRDVMEFLGNVGLAGKLKPLDLKITYQDACHLGHAQRIKDQPRSVLGQIPGVELTELPESELCCGSAGIYNMVEPGMSQRLLERKIKHIKETGADWLVAGNPGCLLQIGRGLKQYGLDIKTAHPVELLDWSYRGAAE
jgi:hypothetical protein